MAREPGSWGRRRAGVVLVSDDGIALIERIRAGRTYYVFPAGGIEDGETAEATAVRECLEELGLAVRLGGLAAVIYFRPQNSWQYYFHAEAIGGVFGTGTGPEYDSASSERGSYRPIWVPPAQLPRLDVRPPKLAALMAEPHSLDVPRTLYEP